MVSEATCNRHASGRESERLFSFFFRYSLAEGKMRSHDFFTKEEMEHRYREVQFGRSSPITERAEYEQYVAVLMGYL
jgi:hypothetical protein